MYETRSFWRNLILFKIWCPFSPNKIWNLKVAEVRFLVCWRRLFFTSLTSCTSFILRTRGRTSFEYIKKENKEKERV